MLINLVPWMPDGVYDLAVEGPGFKGEQLRAVRVGIPTPAPPASLEISQEGDEWVAENRAVEAAQWSFELMVPRTVPGVFVKGDGRLLEPLSVAWSTLPVTGDSHRVLRYELEVAPASGTEPGKTTVTWSTAEERPCKGEIVWRSPGTASGPTGARNMELFTESFNGISVIWDFGDGFWGAGAKERHRWLLSRSATVTATGFDSAGRVCTVVDK